MELVTFFHLFVSCLMLFADGSNILVLSPITAPSHSNFFKPVVNELAKRGHSVTYWNGLKPDGSKKANVTQLYSEPLGVINSDHHMEFKDRDKPIELFLAFYDRTITYCTAIYKDPIFHRLMTMKQHFDVVLLEAVLNECVLPLIHALQVPFIYMNGIAPTPWLLDAIASPQAFDHFPNPARCYTDEMNLWQRTLNTASGLFILFFRKWVLMPTVDRLAASVMDNFTSVTDVEDRHLSLVITNTHFSINYQLPKSTAIIEAGGLHCRPAQPLPKELEKFVNDSGDDGFIIVSFGSILRGSKMPAEVQRVFISTFARLKQRVIWKWEDDNPRVNATLTDNVMLLPWLPQQDLLGHPKARLFITHGGLFSNQEAVYHAVPLIALPVFADQPINARKAQDDGYAIHLDWDTLSEDTLYDAIQSILTDPKYSEKVKEVSWLMHDQMDSPLDRAVYWIEYVIRHGGATHLRTAARKLSAYQRGLVDVTIVMACLVLLFVTSAALILRSSYRLALRPVISSVGKAKKND